MLSIARKEFVSLFKSIKSILIVLIMIAISLGIAKILSLFGSQLSSEIGIHKTPYQLALMLTVILTSPLFAFTLSHNIINEEVKNRTMRFLATKTTRNNILFGKFLGALLFWITCLLITTLLLIIYSHEFYFLELMQSIAFVSYFLGMATLLSVFIDNTMLTNFLGIALSIILTVLGLWSTETNRIWLKLLKYIMPYFYYCSENRAVPFVILIFTIIFLIISLYIFRKRDL
ncbi:MULTISPECIES: ABC transporter permease [Staphylococcus]|uniref:ABC transporter permease n=1 Tax=Staphylococcus TaxID=1279 RepID=UPI0002FD162B|nr:MULTISPECIES: ABC transporter permease subunit [Staphylococcus]MBC3071783.1 ABC transporter permease subunit [Staphylococcus capitis]MBC3082712.1 ABC transporter permease subunit [Staphylococcus capitis]MBO0370623.1 ABC transporter permease subunit [Staphylococcus capitis]MBO0375355.1 ABC transporter permease subunit [Staphylococcus capitis]MCI2952784.1 ABC transporter permease [Staphylococcus capitis]